MEIHEALSQIAEIRDQIARNEIFRGYRAATVAFSGAVAIAAGIAQASVVPEPERTPWAWLGLWIAAAGVNLAVIAAELALRCRRAASRQAVRKAMMAAEQFLPCVAAGALVTLGLAPTLPEHLWILPGLWSIIFSLGVFASVRMLPWPMLWVGAHYLLAGSWLLSTGPGGPSLSPWAMAGAFSTGQILTAAILYLCLEREHDAR